MATGHALGARLRDHARWAALPFGIALASRLFSIALILILNRVQHKRAGNPFATWDATWYLGIARDGYHATPVGYHPTLGTAWHDFAFFPAWPMSMRAAGAVGDLAGVSLPWASVALANLLFLAAAVAAWRVIADRIGTRAATTGIALLAFSPVAYTFSMAYSESLFVLLAALSLLARRSLWRGPLGLLAMLTRIAGGALVVGAAVEVLLARGRERRAAMAAVLGGLVGFALWWGYIARLTGSFTGFLGGSLGWGPNVGLAQFIRVVTEPSIQQTAWVAMLIVSLIGAVLLVRRERELGVFVLVAIALGVFGGLLHSMPRYVLAGFPVFAVLGERTGRRGFWVLLAAFLVGQVIFAMWTIPPRNIAP